MRAFAGSWKRNLLFLSSLAASWCVQAANPIVPGWYADPEIRIFAGQYWIYPTYSADDGAAPRASTFTPEQQRMRARSDLIWAPFLKQTFLDAFSSPDLVHWTKHARVLDVENVGWAAYAVWAPSAIEHKGKYYLFFGANDIQRDGQPGGIGVAVSERPEGPFKDALGKPLIGAIHNGAQPIDQMVFKDDDGQIYMVYGGWKHLNVVKLAPDLLSVTPFADGTTYKEITPDPAYVEGPFMAKRNGKYYLMWSEGEWTGPDYSVAYAMSSSPYGPFKRIAKILEQDSRVATGAGHHSVVNIPGTDDWYIVYHRRPLGEKDGNRRQLAIERLAFNADGTIRPVTLTTSGVAPRQLAPASPPAPALTITVDTESAKAVLDALLKPALTMADALRVAALPGNQGLIRKARSYGRPGTDELFAQALLAAARRDDAAPDPGKFQFGPVRDHAAQIKLTLAKLEDPAADVLAGVKARIAGFTPAKLRGHVTGYLIVGGTSGGFAFDTPEFFLDVDRFPSAPLASTIMQHELFHAVQGLARTPVTRSAAETACIAKIPHGSELSQLFAALEMEGSASLVGDVAAMPAGIDSASDTARKSALRNLGLVGRSITLLELSVHGLNTAAQVGYDEIYELGFYGDEVLYSLGYVMARAIAAEEGRHAIAELTGRPGALFVERYRKLKSYGTSDAVPALYAETLRSADQLAACSAGVSSVQPGG